MLFDPKVPTSSKWGLAFKNFLLKICYLRCVYLVVAGLISILAGVGGAVVCGIVGFVTSPLLIIFFIGALVYAMVCAFFMCFFVIKICCTETIPEQCCGTTSELLEQSKINTYSHSTYV